MMYQVTAKQSYAFTTIGIKSVLKTVV